MLYVWLLQLVEDVLCSSLRLSPLHAEAVVPA